MEHKQSRKGSFFQDYYMKWLSSRELESITAICDSLLPSINYSGTTDEYDDSIATFYKTSASMTGTPQLVKKLIAEKVEQTTLGPLRLSLLLLSTWLGTFILCGSASLSTQFPYVQRFSQISQKKREQILRSWSLSSLFFFRTLFKVFKFITFFIFFTQLDDKNANPTWKGIGYCGPDPNFKNQTKRKKAGFGREDDEERMEEELYGPLCKGLVDLTQPREVVVDKLGRYGFPVSVHCRGSNSPSLSSSPCLTIHCDAVVVGSGSGGGVVAGILAKEGYKVIVLEKGNYFARSNLSLIERPSMDQMYLNGGVMVTDDMGVLLLAGSNVGGGSTINWSASIRTPHHVMKEWCEDYELELFGSQVYKEALDAVCKKMGVQSEVEEEGFNNTILRRGCTELGYPVTNIPRNSTQDHYCGWCGYGCKDGKKKGVAETWLVDLVKSGNGLILPGCNALEILHERKKWRNRNTATGVTFEFDNGLGKDIYVVESKVTIVACGALSTPTLLKRSGLKNDNIGKNLHLHPVVMAWGHFPSNDEWLGKDKKSYEGGIMTAMSTVVADFEGSGYGAVIQTPSVHPGVYSTVMPWVSSSDFKERMCKFSRTAHIFALARDKGKGTVDSQTSFTYKLDATDEENLQKGLEKILRMLAAAGAEEVGTHHIMGKKLTVKKASKHEFEKFVKEESSRRLRDLSTPICSAHQMGSCRMGVDEKHSVVNQKGETWEVEELFLADTSVFPTALGVNPMVTVQAIAHTTAHSILEVLKRKKDGY
ncbi:long-chain-alcohol oxidase FAO4A-like isoform X1 [Macadamia integrifolia]|uniref:long-chain-alcohol oxidase FAO4A-like isoform X1 n=1 Tax=Macadamia integrifolia TaxID=60698 RepID=UPI001C4EB9BA|nr:long-chain-alcohol oxidase FAO4A-like isoform X1 [Macadamia integrifolia]